MFPRFYSLQGRMKFTRPLYRELFALEDTRSTAVTAFKDRALFYHPICRSMAAKDLGVELGKKAGYIYYLKYKKVLYLFRTEIFITDGDPQPLHQPSGCLRRSWLGSVSCSLFPV